MLDDQLTTRGGGHVGAETVLAVLAGTPLNDAAARIGVEPADLDDAIEVYQAAGLAALRAQAADRGWYQVRIEFTDWNAAERIAATGLGPALIRMQDQGLLGAWWFIRKAPCWRLRGQPGPTGTNDLKAAIGPVLDKLVAEGSAQRWWETLYEPESATFGGQTGMIIAHALFHADSRHVLDFAQRQSCAATPGTPDVGRRELSIVLCSGVLRSAGQDWYERGDVWHQVSQLRPFPPATPAGRLPELAGNLRRLLTADTRPLGTLLGLGGPLAYAAPWAAAFDNAGRALNAAAASGTLDRGVRAILAHHIIFHWNRLGLTGRTQAILAKAARDAILEHPSPAPGNPAAGGR